MTDIVAGTIDLVLVKQPEHITEEWIVFDMSAWEFAPQHKECCILMTRLQSAQRIRTQCRMEDHDTLRVRIFIRIFPTPMDQPSPGRIGTLFVELLEQIDRQSMPLSGRKHRQSLHQSVFACQNSARSLLDIFVSLPSPARVEHATTHQPEVTMFLRECLDHPTVDGMKTTLYQYQKASLWKILQRELAPETIPCPYVIKLIDQYGSPYYFDQLSTAVTTTPVDMTDVSGGIICEDMGTGKTCICLATIMATLHLSNLKNTKEHTVQTDLPRSSHVSVRPLRELAAATIILSSINWKQCGKRLPPDIYDMLTTYPGYYEWTDIPPSFYDRPHRRKIDIPVMKIYTSNASLVIVPDNLVAQWTSEVYKHIHDGAIRFLVLGGEIRKKKEPFPLPTVLCHYDLVIISQSVFSREHEAGGFSFGGIRRICMCPYVGSTRVRRCICPPLTKEEAYVSPLLQVHWKRVIADEGHRLSSKNKMSDLAAKLVSNWKWICTGTPTQNLTESTTVHARHDDQLDDIKRLGAMYGSTFKLHPFDKKGMWQRLILTPFMAHKPWAVEALTRLMTQTMIRNRRGDIEREVVLPPLYHKTVYLDFDYYQWMAHNCQIAMIGLNAVLSKREGPDYLFSPRNKKALRETVNNLWQSCLWHSVDLRWLRASHENCVEKLAQVNQGLDAFDEQDTAALLQIKSVVEHALSDEMFMQMMTKHAPSFLVQGLPSVMKEKWGWLQGDHGAYCLAGESKPWDDYCIMDGDLVVDLMRDVTAPRVEDEAELYVYDAAADTLLSTEKTKGKSKTGKKDEGGTAPGKEVPNTDAPNKDPSMLTFYTRRVFSDGRILCSTSSKINYLVDQIVKYHSTEKCIIFSLHYNEMQEIYLALQLARVRTLMYLDSKTTNISRSQTIMTFNTSENANVIIMAVQRAAYGIDLSAATRVYFVSPVWQKAMEQQAIKRAHRIGQTRPVHVETLVIRDTIEDALLKRRDAMLRRHQDAQTNQSEFFNDKRLQMILCHAKFVPLPEHIVEHGNAIYQQVIAPLREPLYFVPPSTAKEDPAPEPVATVSKEEIIRVESDDEPEDGLADGAESEKAPVAKQIVRFADPVKRPPSQDDTQLDNTQKRVRFAM